MPTNQRWLSKYQVGTRSGIKRQYKKYFSNAQNVFYQDSTIVIMTECIDILLPILTGLLIILIITYNLINSIQPYDKKCPYNAKCGAYINCNIGYVLNSQQQICQVDPYVKQTAQSVVDQLVSSLQYIYGDSQCSPQLIDPYQQYPRISIYELFDKIGFKTQSNVLKNQIRNLFNNQNLQKIAGFKKDNNGYIFPTKKQYSLHCRIDLFIIHYRQVFFFIVIFLIIIICVIWYLLRQFLHDKKAKQIYYYLKQELQKTKSKQLDIEIYRPQIQKKFNKNFMISEDQWIRINNYRIEQALIGSYQDVTVKWRLIVDNITQQASAKKNKQISIQDNNIKIQKINFQQSI